MIELCVLLHYDQIEHTFDPHSSGLVRWEYVNWHTGQTPIFKKFSGLYLKYYNSTRPKSGRNSGFLMPSFIRILMFRTSNLCRLTVPHLACLWILLPVKNPDFELAIDWESCMIQTQLHYCHEAELSYDNIALRVYWYVDILSVPTSWLYQDCANITSTISTMCQD